MIKNCAWECSTISFNIFRTASNFFMKFPLWPHFLRNIFASSGFISDTSAHMQIDIFLMSLSIHWPSFIPEKSIPSIFFQPTNMMLGWNLHSGYSLTKLIDDTPAWHHETFSENGNCFVNHKMVTWPKWLRHLLSLFSFLLRDVISSSFSFTTYMEVEISVAGVEGIFATGQPIPGSN